MDKNNWYRIGCDFNPDINSEYFIKVKPSDKAVKVRPAPAVYYGNKYKNDKFKFITENGQVLVVDEYSFYEKIEPVLTHVNWQEHGLPERGVPCLCIVEHLMDDEMTNYEVLFYDERDAAWFRWVRPYNGSETNDAVRINRRVLKWIQLPEVK